MDETSESMETQTVWVVFCGDENDKGEIESFEVVRVYGRRDLAEEFVKSWSEVEEFSGERFSFWVEAHDVHFEHDTEGKWPM